MGEMTLLKRIALIVTIIIDLFFLVIGIQGIIPLYDHAKVYLVLFPLFASIVRILLSIVGCVLVYLFLKGNISFKLYLIIQLTLVLLNTIIPIICML